MECIKVTGRPKNDYNLNVELELKLTSKELVMIFLALEKASTTQLRKSAKQYGLDDLKVIDNEDYLLYSEIKSILENDCNFDLD